MSDITLAAPDATRTGRLARLVDSDRFNLAISAVIIANAIVLGLETFPGVVDSFGSTLIVLNEVFYVIFVAELVLRLVSYGRRPQDFFKNPWNVFDFIIIGGVLIPAVREQAQLLRLLRLLRIVRLVRFLPDARVLLLTVVKSIPSMVSMIVLTVLLLFLYGMIGWAMFGEALPETWGTIGKAMLTLFILLTLENFPTYLDEAKAVTPWAIVFFVTYVLVAAFVVFNLLIGIVIGSMEKAREHEAEVDRTQEDSDLLQRISDLQDSLTKLQADIRRREREQHTR
jgi:voltage-gated sodium channel